MCGIAGFLFPGGEDAEVIRRMTLSLRHRGPDDDGIFVDQARGVALGHRRLSILDLSPRGRNPMAGEAGRLRIVHNGEVYNFGELRRELERLGHGFRTGTDTEVILAAYAAWGPGCLERFVGMFAFAIWDEERERLFVARDRLGKKPLYLASYGSRVAFVSELKALLADPSFPDAADPEALRLYLRYGYVPAPRTAFAAARKLPPGHYAWGTRGGWETVRYWDPLEIASRVRVPAALEEAERELEALLGEAVEQRLIADVPVGAFLSGGIDSSLVAALMRERSRGPVRTFTIRFPQKEFNEADHAAAVARHLGTEHHEETCSEGEMLELVERIPALFDEPFADSSAIPSLMVARLTRRHVTVALSGDGGDELFFGYPRYPFHAWTRHALRAPFLLRRAAAQGLGRFRSRRWRRAASILGQREPDTYARFVTAWDPGEIARMTGALPEESAGYAEARRRTAGRPAPERPPLIDLMTYLPEDILVKVDRATMAASLEARCPLLDHRVVEAALALPLKWKWRGGQTKWILRRLLYRKVPRELVDRPKMGFGVPLPQWFRGPLRSTVEAALTGGWLEQAGVGSEPAREAWKDFLAGRLVRTEILWNAYCLAAWARARSRRAAEPASAAGC
ncbi:MAG: asparagine synthase (glutamine-hydrolyzing) [Thermoanaerobaculia bacterium]